MVATRERDRERASVQDDRSCGRCGSEDLHSEKEMNENFERANGVVAGLEQREREKISVK